MKILIIANSINNLCKEYKYFWAIGLIKETLSIWKKPDNYKLLNGIAKIFVNKEIDNEYNTN